MSSPVFLASASSKRVEIDSLGLAELTKGDDGVMRRILAAKVNEQETWHYWTQDGRIITAVADGLPANFQDVNSIAPELIDHTMALMLLGAEKAAQARGKATGLVDLDAGQQFELQAKMEGLGQARSSSADIELKVGALSFFGSKDAWMAIAKSPATPPAVTEALIDAYFEKDPMNPILLEALAQPKEITDAWRDKLLDLGLLPHVARLLRNEGLKGHQEDRLVEFVTRAYDDITEYRHEGKYRHVYAVEKVPDGQWRVVPGAGSVTANEQDLVVRQLGQMLFAHKRCPECYKNWMLDSWGGSKLRFERQANVHALSNPTWTTEQLTTMLTDSLSSLYSLGIEKPQRAAYAFDVLEAFRDHPSATDAIIRDAERALAYLRQTQLERRGSEPRGKHDWVPSPLGGTAPAYD